MKDDAFKDSHLDALRSSSGVALGVLPRPALGSGARNTARPSKGLANNFYRRKGKRIIDIMVVLIGLPVILPVTMLCAMALWLEGGNPFYRQQRLGAGAQVFSILKLRTMCRDADSILESHLEADPALRAEWAHSQKLKDDPRITRVGAILRKTSLDELPQFWNVLRGEMSVVGPRPMMPDQLGMYGDPYAYFALRPGITGAWQVSERNASSFAYRRTIDTRYQQTLSMWKDLRILFLTVGVVLRRTGY